MTEEELAALCEIAEIVNGLKLSDLNGADPEEHPLVEIGAIVAQALGGKFVPGDGVDFIEDGAAPTPEPGFIEDDETDAH